MKLDTYSINIPPLPHIFLAWLVLE